MNEAKPAEQHPCAGCGQPTCGMCWTDCGMSLCGQPLCSNCQHVDEKYGWRHEPRARRTGQGGGDDVG